MHDPVALHRAYARQVALSFATCRDGGASAQDAVQRFLNAPRRRLTADEVDLLMFQGEVGIALALDAMRTGRGPLRLGEIAQEYFRHAPEAPPRPRWLPTYYQNHRAALAVHGLREGYGLSAKAATLEVADALGTSVAKVRKAMGRFRVAIVEGDG